MLSRGARLCESIIRASRARSGGARVCGRPYLARRLGCSVRTVSRYVAELRDAGRLDVTPPKRVRTCKGWRSTGTNTYRLPCKANPAPHVVGPARLRRSARDATRVTPPPKGVRAGGPPALRPPVWETAATIEHDRDPAARLAARAAARAALRAAS